MKYPNLSEEKRLWKKGFKSVIGLDEAGRGPLAGPVVAAAVNILDTRYQIPAFTKVSAGRQNIKIRDSKQLTFSQREKIYKIIIKDPRLQWGIGIVSEKIIDRINILEATKLAMIKAVKNLQQRKYQSKISKSILSQKPTIVGKEDKIDFLILDGNFILPTKALTKIGIKKLIPQKSIIRGDEKVFSCSAASIIAKVTRDRIMVKLHKKYPKYRFDLHKGYGTKLHLKMLNKYGPCEIHRKTFKPIFKYIDRGFRESIIKL
ncbi:MAG: ribonuclease HII [Parcubacteria group bacterium CG10_big_fil_rev_8_21_14_0_10_35_15]|nr:MAG: ribonuclease HII [Parcubacteria group bacterium CG10_big_fil_rev_8_21_14_0_10_35_15]